MLGAYVPLVTRLAEGLTLCQGLCHVRFRRHLTGTGTACAEPVPLPTKLPMPVCVRTRTELAGAGILEIQELLDSRFRLRLLRPSADPQE